MSGLHRVFAAGPLNIHIGGPFCRQISFRIVRLRPGCQARTLQMVRPENFAGVAHGTFAEYRNLSLEAISPG